MELGLAGLEIDAPQPGRTRIITPAKVQEVVRKTTQEKPSNATHWSTRTMAEAVGLSEESVRRIWHEHGLKPHLSRTLKVSNDPEFAEELEQWPSASLAVPLPRQLPARFTRKCSRPPKDGRSGDVQPFGYDAVALPFATAEYDSRPHAI